MANWAGKKRIYHWIGFGLCLLAIGYLASARMPAAVVSYGDSVQYWAAGRLIRLGENPYSPELVRTLRAESGSYADFPANAVSMMLYPPWVIPFLLPFGALDYALSRLLWFFFHLAVLVFATGSIWRLYGGSKQFQWVAYALAFTFAPTLLVLLVGHITTLHLLGLIGFLYFISRPRRKVWSDLAAGACAALVTFKPQLLYLFLLALFLWALQRRRWMVLAGGAGLLLITSAIALFLDPHIFVEYWSAVTAYPFGAWVSPALGTVLRRALGYWRQWLQLMPPSVGLIWFGYYWIKQRRSWDWLEQVPALVLASFVTSAYMWSADMVVLLLPVLQVSTALIKSQARGQIAAMFALYFAINGMVIYQFITVHNDYFFFWLVPALVAWWLLGNYVTRRAVVLQYGQE